LQQTDKRIGDALIESCRRAGFAVG
jgi:hypothetical protein